MTPIPQFKCRGLSYPRSFWWYPAKCTQMVVSPHTQCPLCERTQLLLEQQPAPLPPDLSEMEEELRKATQLVVSLQKQLVARREEHLQEIEAYWRRLLAQASLHTVAKMLNQALHTAHAAGVPLDDLTQWAQSDEVWKNR